jgi:hypothetical protein
MSNWYVRKHHTVVLVYAVLGTVSVVGVNRQMSAA